MLSAQTHALAEEQERRTDPSLLIEIEVASDSGPLFSFLLRVPYNLGSLLKKSQNGDRNEEARQVRKEGCKYDN